jgi:transposase
MNFPKKPPLVLTDRERVVLEQLANSRTMARRLGERATIILRLATGMPKEAIAREVWLTRKVVYLWYDRWLAAQDKLPAAAEVSDKEFRQVIEEILADRPRPGAPLTFTAEQVCQIMALSCHKPEELGLPFTTWTPAELARTAGRQGIVPAISPASVGRFLQSGGFAAP